MASVSLTSAQELIHLLLVGIPDDSALSVTLHTLETNAASAIANAPSTDRALTLLKLAKVSEPDVLVACAHVRNVRNLHLAGGAGVAGAASSLSHSLPKLRAVSIPASCDVSRIDSSILGKVRGFDHTKTAFSDYVEDDVRALACEVAPVFGLAKPTGSSKCKRLVEVVFACKNAMLNAGVLSPPQICAACNKVWHCSRYPPQVKPLCNACETLAAICSVCRCQYLVTGAATATLCAACVNAVESTTSSKVCIKCSKSFSPVLPTVSVCDACAAIVSLVKCAACPVMITPCSSGFCAGCATVHLCSLCGRGFSPPVGILPVPTACKPCGAVKAANDEVRAQLAQLSSAVQTLVDAESGRGAKLL